MITGKEYFLTDVNHQYKVAAFYLMQPEKFKDFTPEAMETFQRISQYPGLKLVDCHGLKVPEMTHDLLSIFFRFFDDVRSVTGQYPSIGDGIELFSHELSILPEIEGDPKTDHELESKMRRIDLIALRQIFKEFQSVCAGEIGSDVGPNELVVILVMIAIDHFQAKKAVFQNFHGKVNEIPFKYLKSRGGPRTISPSICKRCPKIFIRYSRTIKYCPNCQQEPEIIKKELQLKRRKERKDERPQKYCKNCGKPLTERNLKREYCDNKGKCKVAFHRKKLKRYDLSRKNVTEGFFSVFGVDPGLS